MYNSYFGFREKPFKLVPNPDYLFLSKNHEIALAHLTYATEEDEGFVVITGEVGTGKTTLCRNFLEGLNKQVSSAYIFHPRLESSQLLASICGEFGIATEASQIKTLIDLFNNYLIEQNAAGRKVVLLIDEAQGLSIENLELVRMLSNLETTRSKLLQIILVGQPELGDILDSYELRQLAQRISLHYQLAPLSAKETEAYIYHRLGIATKNKAVIFNSEACRAAYHFSGGVPRLINIVCDRALLLAFSNNQPKVTKGVMQSAIAELLNRGQPKRSGFQWRSFALGGFVILFVAVAALGWFVWNGGLAERDVGGTTPAASQAEATVSQPATATFKVLKPVEDITAPAQVKPSIHAEPQTPTEEIPPAQTVATGSPAANTAIANEPVADKTEQPAATPPVHMAPKAVGGPKEPRSAAINQIIAALDPKMARKEAVSALLTLWQQPNPNPNLLPDQMDDALFYDLAARQYGLRVLATQWDWDLIQRLDLPFIAALRQNGESRDVYLTITGESQGRLQVSSGGQGPVFETDLEALVPFFAGPVYVFWRNTIGFDMLIGHGADRNAVLGVKNLLRQIGYKEVPLTPEFDTYTVDVVKNFQARNDLFADGLVGPLTKIMLLRQAANNGMPHLKRLMGADS